MSLLDLEQQKSKQKNNQNGGNDDTSNRSSTDWTTFLCQIGRNMGSTDLKAVTHWVKGISF